MTIKEDAAVLLAQLLEETGVDASDIQMEVRMQGAPVESEDIDRISVDLTEYGMALRRESEEGHLSDTNQRRVEEMHAAITVAVAGLAAVRNLSALFMLEDKEEGA